MQSTVHASGGRYSYILWKKYGGSLYRQYLLSESATSRITSKYFSAPAMLILIRT